VAEFADEVKALHHRRNAREQEMDTERTLPADGTA
jgi:hypothetical protein